MDVNWCLNCECSFEGTGPYCSRRCEPLRASSSSYPSVSTASSSQYTDEEDIIYHHVDDASSQSQWIGKGDAGIRAWAASIAPSSSRASSIASSSSSSSRYSSRYSSPNSSSARLPKLIQVHQKPAPPALGISTSRPSLPSPSRPILTPLQTMRTSSGEIIGTYSTGNLSIASGATDSSLATPVSASPALPIPCKKSSMFSAFATHIRSLASSPSSIAPTSRPRMKMDTCTSQRPVAIVDVSSSDFDDAGELTWQYSGTTVVVDGPISARKLSDMPRISIPHGRNLSRA